MSEQAPSKILVATDFSDTAHIGAQWAIEIARNRGMEIHLLHVLTLPHPWPHYAPAPPELGESLEKGAAERLAAEAEKLTTADVAVTTRLEIGIPSQVILETARELSPGLLVIGTRGLSGLSHLLLGSTAERVVQKADCPVLTVHPEDGAPPRPIETVLVPTDFSDDAKVAIETARRLLRGQGIRTRAKLVLVHAYALPIEYTAYGPIPTSVHYLENTGAEAQAALEEAADELRGEGLTVEAVTREGYPPEVIVTEAERAGADLIAMGTHGRTGLAHLLLGSTAERVVQRAGCPVMTVRREAEADEEGSGD